MNRAVSESRGGKGPPPGVSAKVTGLPVVVATSASDLADSRYLLVAAGIFAIALVLLLFAVLFHFSPNVSTGRIRLFTAGAGVALLVWILASAGFAFYVGNFGSYNETYGTLGGFVVLLVWFWISNMAVLFGLELNSEIERTRQIDEGVAGAERQLQFEPRAEPKPKQTA